MSDRVGHTDPSPEHRPWCESNYTTTDAPYEPKPCNCGEGSIQYPSRCDSVHVEGKSSWRCARIAGHSGKHSIAGTGRVSGKEWR